MNTVAQTGGTLHVKEKNIVLIAAFTATGDLALLQETLHTALADGLTINEVREELIQLYAYCGFPRSLNGITTLMAVLEQRKSKGIADQEGPGPQLVSGTNEQKYEAGKKALTILTGKSQDGPLSGANAFAPGIDSFLKEHLFADIFGRGVLTYQEREIATITALSCMPGLEAQLLAHLNMGMNVGLTQPQLTNLFQLLEDHVSKKQADAARAVLVTLNASK